MKITWFGCAKKGDLDIKVEVETPLNMYEEAGKKALREARESLVHDGLLKLIRGRTEILRFIKEEGLSLSEKYTNEERRELLLKCPNLRFVYNRGDCYLSLDDSVDAIVSGIVDMMEDDDGGKLPTTPPNAL